MAEGLKHDPWPEGVIICAIIPKHMGTDVIKCGDLRANQRAGLNNAHLQSLPETRRPLLATGCGCPKPKLCSSRRSLSGVFGDAPGVANNTRALRVNEQERERSGVVTLLPSAMASTPDFGLQLKLRRRRNNGSEAGDTSSNDGPTRRSKPRPRPAEALAPC